MFNVERSSSGFLRTYNTDFHDIATLIKMAGH